MKDGHEIKAGDSVLLRPNLPGRSGYRIGTSSFNWVKVKVIVGRLVRVVGRAGYGRKEKEFVVSIDDIERVLEL